MVSSIINYQFKDPTLLDRVCIHRSLNPDYHNGTLETLGDLVIALCVGSRLYHDKPHITLGTLSNLQAVNVDNERLARVCLETGLFKHLYHHIPDMGQRVDCFQRDVRRFKVHSCRRIDTPTVLADLVEAAVVGAVWVDSGRNIGVTAAVVDILLGGLIVNSARFGERPIHCRNFQ